MLNELKCKICGYEASTKQGFNSHLSHGHHINGYYTHCNHWFDSNNSDDVIKLNELIEKSKYHSMYNTCIRVWTQSDVEKRNCAKNNKLNYVVVWSKQDILDWINSGLEIRHDY